MLVWVVQDTVAVPDYHKEDIEVDPDFRKEDKLVGSAHRN
jgi:hypothetical protein